MSFPTILMPTYNSPPRARNARPPRIAFSNPEPSPTLAFDDNPKWKLFITTNSKICAWDIGGCEPIFTSSSRGIVAAKRAQDGSVLAIADAQVVMLHQMKDGQDKSYRLRGTQRCRLLQYSHDSRNLFYTDSLHNSVQLYSLSEKRVADAAKSHPSPITAFAVSCDSNLILSASALPPTIQIYNQLLGTTISLAPTASSSPVVTCAFHPSRKQLFMLAFGDGVLAAYDYSKLNASGNKDNKKENAGLGVTRCHARGVHAFRHLHDPSIAGSAGITGAGFVPGQRSRAVTVGEDGRCFLVDFEKGDTLGSWHIGAPATGLTIREIDAKAKTRRDELGGYFIAVGTIHGKCVVYDGNGNKVTERIIDVEGESVLDVEWVYGDVSLPEGDVLSLSDPVSASASPRKSVSPDRPRKANRSRTRGGKLSDATNPLFGHNINPIVSLPAPVEDEAVIEDTQASENHVRRRHRAFSPPVYDSLEDATDQGYMKLFSPVKRKRVIKAASLPEKKAENMNKSTDPRIRAETQTSDHRSAISAPQLWEDQPKEAEIANINKETVPEMEDYGFGAFQTDTQKETTTADDTLPGTGKSSVFDVLSSVPATQIRMEERTDDGRILSEIKSIRAMFSGKSKESSGKDTNPPLLAPFLPNISKSTPSSRVGTAPAAASTLRRTVSFPDGKIYPSDIYTSDEVESTEHVGDKSFVKPPTNEPENAESAQAQEILLEPEVQKEEPAEEEDIWLAQTVTSRASRKLSRKRKKDASGDEDIVNTTINPSPAVGINLSRSTSSARSSKSRKTVSWSDDPEPQQQLSRGDIFPTPIAMASSSMIGEYSQSGASSQHRINSTQTATIATETGPNTVSTDKPSSEGSSDGKSIEQIVKAALVEMQRAMCLQMSSMQAEMGRQFREQNHELQGLKNEMERVRLENEKLRNMLFKSTGVRESVKKAGGPSGGTQLR